MYKVYGDIQANPAMKWDCQIGTGVDTLLEAVELAQNTPYSYVEIKLPNGTILTLPDAKTSLRPVNFLLFAGDDYYPLGGYNDLKATAATEDELRDIIEANSKKARYGSSRFDWWQIVNAHTHVIVDQGSY